MRSWKVHRRAPDASLPIDAVERLTRSLGEPSCGRVLLDVLNCFAKVDHCALFVRSQGADLRLLATSSLATSSRLSASNAARAAVHYMDQMHRYDVGTSEIRPGSGDDGTVELRYRTSEEVTNLQYRLECYEHVGIEDRLAMFDRRPDGTTTMLHCYRDRSTGRFSDDELEVLAKVAPLFLSFVCVHARLVVPQDIPASRWRESLDQNIGASLSCRELDVCASLLSGLTLAQTGQQLGISVNTVITYSRRAYAKLGVDSVRELHARLVTGPAQTAA